MNGRCSKKNCYSDGPCALGEMEKIKCKSWSRNKNGGEEPGAPEEKGSNFVSWNGHLIGSDISSLAAHGRPLIIALMGPKDAGKTTFLVTAYSGLRLGSKIALGTFAGSNTLAAWEELSAWTRSKVDRPGSFPPRTSSSSLNSAGLLHIAIRTPEGSLRDILFTDAPGEWFHKWVVKADGKEAEGARWISENADAFLVFADSDTLAGKDRGPAKGELINLIGRISTIIENRPASVVWAKSDISVPTGIKSVIDNAQNNNLPGSSSWEVSYKKPKTIQKAVSDIINLAAQPRFSSRILEPVVEISPFLAFRG